MLGHRCYCVYRRDELRMVTYIYGRRDVVAWGITDEAVRSLSVLGQAIRAGKIAR